MISVNYIGYYEKVNKHGSACFLAVLFLLFPFAAFAYSLFRFQKKSSRIIIILFIALFGYNMIAEFQEMDLFRYHTMLQQYASQSVDQIFRGFFISTKGESSVWVADNNYMDVYVSLVCTFLSRLTTNGHILMGCFGLIYGLAMVKVLEQFLDKDGRMDRNVFTLILCASFAIPLYMLAGVRHGTATFFFVWAVISNINKQWVKSFVLLFLACITHFVFLLPSILFLIYTFLFSYKYSSVFKYPLYGLYILSFFLSDITSSYIDSALPFLNTSLFERASLYSNPDAVESITKAYFEDTNLFVTLKDDLIYWFCAVGLLLLRTKYFDLSLSSRTEKIYFWVILFMILTNFSLSIPDLGVRLKYVMFLFFFFCVSQIYNENKDNAKLKFFIICTFLFAALKIVVESRIIIEYTTPILFMGNLYYVLTDNSTASVWTLLKNR